MEKRAFLVGLFAAVAASATLPAAEYFADAINGSDANDGRTEATAKLSLKAALALADTGDTVTLLPGDYTNGVETTSSTYSRGYINKQITLRSKNGRASRDMTRIVGKYDYEGGTGNGKTGGMGDNAVRGLWVTAAAAGTVIEGISFVDCSAPFLTGSGDATTGGGIYFGYGGYTSENADKLYVVDCAFIRCQATRGAGMYGGTSVRCLFKGCRHTKFGAGQRAGSSYNSIFDDCHVVPGLGQDTKISGGVFGYIRYVVNCTIINCEPQPFSGLGTALGVYNCICQNNSSQTLTQSVVFNSVTDTSSMTSNSCAVSQVWTQPEVWSPLEGDYRLNAGAKSLTTGSPDWLTQIPAAYRDTDYLGNPRTTDGTVYCGAVQDVAAVRGSGFAVRLPTTGETMTMDGQPLPVGFRTWFLREDWPYTVQFGIVSDSATRGLVNFQISGVNYWPLADDTIHLVTPHNALRSIEPQFGAIVHVDPVAGDDANDGSEAAPLRTLQKAVTCTANRLVLAHAGDYAEGGAEWSGSNRVYVSTEKLLRVKAVEGTANTFITGAADPAPVIANDYGLGPAAVRCVGAVTNANCCFQGFTLRDGHAGYYNANNDDAEYVHGGALMNAAGISSTYKAVLADCLITNCVSSRGPVFGGSIERCRVTGCNVVKMGLLRSCRAVASVIDHNPAVGGTILSQAAYAYNCTFVTNNCPVVNNEGYLYNCVMGWRNGQDIGTYVPKEMRYSLYSSTGVTPSGTAYVGNQKETPIKFVSPETGDWRLAAASAGATLGWASFFDTAWVPAISFDGTPFAISEGGRVAAGAFNVRPVANIYADAVNGNDVTGDGATEGTAFKTLAAALAAAVPGDTVTALPGVYSDGSALPTRAETGVNQTPMTPARVVVPSYVTLESRDGPETTVIEGASATANANSWGCGDGAVRCVFLCANATIRGFTLRGGRTASGGTSYTDSIDARGGGVLAAGATAVANAHDIGVSQNCVAEICIVTNCAAARGGGSFGGLFRKCRFYSNKAPKPGVGAYWSRLEGCLFANHSGHSVAYKSHMLGCTFMPHASSSDTSPAVNNEGCYLPVVNTVIGTPVIKATILTNCAYAVGMRNADDRVITDVNPAVGDLRLAPDGTLLEGSVAIDAGDVSCLPEGLGDTDLAGGQRVYNGAMDIGCFEFDWRPKYAAILGKGLTVTAASPEVYAVGESAVAVPGGSLEAAWANGNGGRREFSGLMNVTGTGTLTTARGGETFATLTSADGEQMFKFFSGEALEELVFAYEPGEGDTGAALLSSFAASQGLTIILR